jgi:hypothetical protein
VQDIDFNAQGGNLRKHNISANPSVGCVYLWSWYAAAAVLLMTATCQKNLIMFEVDCLLITTECNAPVVGWV